MQELHHLQIIHKVMLILVLIMGIPDWLQVTTLVNLKNMLMTNLSKNSIA